LHLRARRVTVTGLAVLAGLLLSLALPSGARAAEDVQVSGCVVQVSHEPHDGFTLMIDDPRLGPVRWRSPVGAIKVEPVGGWVAHSGASLDAPERERHLRRHRDPNRPG
jgi:hypothetical protein